jgi:hypothetical protein
MQTAATALALLLAAAATQFEGSQPDRKPTNDGMSGGTWQRQDDPASRGAGASDGKRFDGSYLDDRPDARRRETPAMMRPLVVRARHPIPRALPENGADRAVARALRQATEALWA